MINGKLLQPQILHALARAGHGAKILISDGNYPHWPKHGPNAEVVFLNLSPGKVFPRHASAGTGLSTAFGRMLAKLALASDSLHASRPRRRR